MLDIMIFTNRNFFGVAIGDFLQENYIAYTSIGRINTTKGMTPAEGTAIDKNKQLSLRKAYEENLERKKIGLQMDNTQTITVYDKIQNKIKKTKRIYFGYGYNEIYGYVDTTGTVSGISSSEATHFSILEIIEKNEMMLFWYKSLGDYIIKDEKLDYLIKNMNYSSETVEVFRAKNLTNFPVYFVILISENKLIASGAGIAETDEAALKKALKEARLLEWLNKDNPLSHLSSISSNENDEILEHLNKMRKDCKNKTIMFKSYEEEAVSLQLPDWITSLDFHVLNTKNDCSSLTVKCLSIELINCLPTKDRLLNKKKVIHDKYNINNDVLSKCPSCLLL
ncbi:hypothetical protein FC756_24545 [Lysinibacillus mangiferihumi]|uniref:YcaO domain-containing protein n=1 Tax=Lysinibacillus mangiferihumi TaxID=1130819 RepID=A0A4U2XZC1_9BACI|nr:YcaO-like family protein [Lysinibacillus mangiferihumi]TKI53327.1 hypothetical protein FC756_24545 [Lysinibacillus mangiferihumi]